MADENEYVCPACGGSGQVNFGHEAHDGEHVDEGTSPCWACNRSGRVGEEQVYRHRLIVLSRLLAERAVELRQDTPLKQQAFTHEGQRHEFGPQTFIEVKTMELQGHFECDLSKIRPDLVETLFDLLAVPKPKRWIDHDVAENGEDVPF